MNSANVPFRVRADSDDFHVQQIDAEELKRIISEHGAALTLYARQWCRTPEDALQEALIELLYQSPVPEHPPAWLFATVRHRAINLSRAERRRTEHHREAADQRESWFLEERDEEFESGELAEMLDRLPSLEREIIVMRIWGELPFERISDLVHMSTSAAHRRYHRALSMLSQMMQTRPGRVRT